MQQKLHFISGLPRSGSTLLAAIFRQNPRFHADISSPLGAFFQAMLRQFSATSEHAMLVSDDRREALLKGLFSAYYDNLTDTEVIFDTNRMWNSKLPALTRLYPNAKIICTVRNVAWVMDSMERIFRKQPFENTKLFADDSERNSVYARVDTLAQRDRLVGFPWSALKEAFYSEEASSLLVVDYDLLTRAPDKVIALIYQFLDEEPFPHDFNNVQFDAPQFDNAFGLSGLHKIRSKVAFQPRETVLPPDLFEKYAELSFWNTPGRSRAQMITVQTPQTPSNEILSALSSSTPSNKE